jgi:hypothetical protein
MTTDHVMFAKKKAKCSVVVWGFTYLLLFPFLSLCYAPMVRFNSVNPFLLDNIIGIIDLCPIFAMPLTVFLMWYSYSKAYYHIVRICWVVPIFFFVVALLFNIVLALL